ncbi:MAG: CDP-2,3-bis-(O-geranylgeranyl)-sn-glycerol synthase [Thermoplasmata archaeon]|jgi:CDP-2,3-bis-(O-geranylgeranyl)-sn-glycerol synthase|nr:CDP-2,3-bis-(O-geranylgeranyl)-sn-glycerol synthase [Thermoplasmata archaeon]
MDFMEILTIIALGFWLFIPAMLVNTGAVFAGKLCSVKMDFGKTWKGKRILGDGKSWSGFIGGIAFGVFIGMMQVLLASNWDSDNYWGYGPYWDNLGIIFCLSFGGLFGDLCGAFTKRRLGLERGEKAPILDQYDFVAGAFIITSIFYPNWVYETYFEGANIAAFIFLLLIMWGIHRSFNILGYKIGVKNEPW